MMKGRKYEFNKYLQILKQQDIKSLMTTINYRFIPEYSSSFDLQQFYEHLYILIGHDKDIIYQQGDFIQDYLFVIDGIIVINQNNKLQTIDNKQSIIKGPQLIGEYFYSNNKKRKGTATILSNQATILSISKDTFHEIMTKQISQYYQIIKQINLFCSINRLTLQKAKLFSSSRIIQYRINQIFNHDDKEILIISSGECKVYDKFTQQQVIINQFNCIGVEEYFSYRNQHQSQTTFIYKANSSQLRLIALSYDFIDKMPEHFIKQLEFVLKSHSFLGKSKETRKTVIEKQEFTLPQIQKATKQLNKQKNESLSIFKQKRNQLRIKKSQSSQFFKGIPREDIKSFQKQYVLGFINKQPVDHSLAKSKKNNRFKGYFEMKSLVPRQRYDSLQKKDWASYIRLKSIQKQNKKKEGQLLQNQNPINRSFINDNSKLFQNIYKKYQNVSKINKAENLNKLTKLNMDKLNFKKL